MTKVKLTLRFSVLLFSASALALTSLSPGRADEKAGKTYKLKARAMAVDAVSLALQVGKGRSVVVHTAEDYRDRVIVGAQVTAWYHPQGEINKLDRLEYPLEVSFVPLQECLPRIKKVILLPSSNAGDAEPLFDAIEQLLAARLNWVVSHRMLAEEMRRRHEKASPARRFYPSSRREMSPAPLPRADAGLIQKIASETRVDAVLETQVEYVMVKLDSYTAAWDGARETLGSTRERAAAMLTLRPVRGQVPATTVILRLHDPQGRLLWSRRRGFSTLAQRVGGRFRERPISEAVANSAFLSAWLNDVFGSWLLPSDNRTPAR